MATLPKPNDITTEWSNENDCYLARCIDYPDIIGVGKTPEDAIQVYNELLEEDLNDPPVKSKGGRPKKHNTKIMYNVSFDIKAFIELEAVRLDLNQGTILEKIVKFYQETNKEELSKYYSF